MAKGERLSERRKEISKTAEKRVKESYDSRDDYGGGSSIFRDDTEFETWYPKKGSDYVMDILPYITGEGNPKWDKGEITYVLPIWIHKNIGPNGDRVICPAKNYDKPCPICEEIKRLRDGGAEDSEWKPYKATRRSIYNVIVRDDGKQEKKGVQVLDVAFFFMENHISALAKKSKSGAFIPFYDPSSEIGRSVSFEVKDKGKDNVEFMAHKLEERDYDIEDDDLDSVYCLEDLLDQKTYEELYELFWQEEFTGKKGPPKSQRDDDDRKSKKSKKDDDDDDDRSSRRRRSKDDDDDDDRKSKKKSRDDDDDDDRSSRRKRSHDDDDDDDDRKSKKSKKDDDDDDECPKGYIFGEDIDKHDACQKCKVFEACAAKNEELEDKKKSKKKLNRR